jgi:hypothetical protein
MPTSGSRTEFLAVDELGAAADIKYGRTGGWFVSTRKAIFLALLAILGMVLVGILVYYMAACKGVKLVQIAINSIICVTSQIRLSSLSRYT